MIARVVTALLGVWLIAAPRVLGYAGAARADERVVGVLVVALSILASFEAVRALRWSGLAAGAWLLVAPSLLHTSYLARLDGTVVGLLLAACAAWRGPVRHARAGGFRSLLPTQPPRAGDELTLRPHPELG